MMSTLLVLTQPLPVISEVFPKVLKEALKFTKKKLSIHVDHGTSLTPIYPNQASHIICSMYATAACNCPEIDVRVLLPSLKQQGASNPINKIQFDDVLVDMKSSITLIEEKYNSFLHGKNICYLLEHPPNLLSTLPDCIATDNAFNEVVIGGTFDRIHLGHKIFLSETLLRTKRRLTIGLADGPLLAKKTLKDLIHPYEIRKQALLKFLTDIDNGVDYNIARIEEPMGPTKWDDTLELLVVSEETLKGVDYINSRRADSGLPTLKHHSVGLLQDVFHKAGIEEVKFSSSSERLRLLGTRLKDPVPKLSLPQRPYIIGLTGGSASGKTNISMHLREMGAIVINCDKLGHEAYKVGTDGYRKIVEEFGKKILLEDGSVDRAALGQIVFSNPDHLVKLNEIVWPEIAELFLSQLEVHKEAPIIILDAAILLEAKWDKYCHEVWTTFITKEEAIDRIMKRDGKSKEQASQRIENQLSNVERIANSHIVFSSQWDYHYTKSQVEKAWQVLLSEKRI